MALPPPSPNSTCLVTGASSGIGADIARELAEQMQGAQKVAWADNAIKLAVDMTVAGINRLNLQGNAEQQAEELRVAMGRLFPEAVTLVREAREGFGT